MGGGAEEMSEGTRDTGFMLEWMLFTKGLQEDCTICYFLKTAGGKKKRASQEPENLNEKKCRGGCRSFACFVHVHMQRVVVCVFELFVYSHGHWSVYMHVCPVSWDKSKGKDLFICDM